MHLHVAAGFLKLNSVQMADHATYMQGHALVLVQEHCRSDLANVIQHCVYRIPIRIIKGIFLQLLQGLEACHSAGSPPQLPQPDTTTCQGRRAVHHQCCSHTNLAVPPYRTSRIVPCICTASQPHPRQHVPNHITCQQTSPACKRN